MFPHHLPIFIQSGACTTVIQAVKELGRHKKFGQAHIILALTVRTVMHRFVSSEITLRMQYRPPLRVIFMKLSVQLRIPSFFIAVAPPDNRRMIHIANHHFTYQLLPYHRFVLAVPTG